MQFRINSWNLLEHVGIERCSIWLKPLNSEPQSSSLAASCCLAAATCSARSSFDIVSVDKGNQLSLLLMNADEQKTNTLQIIVESELSMMSACILRAAGMANGKSEKDAVSLISIEYTENANINSELVQILQDLSECGHDILAIEVLRQLPSRCLAKEGSQQTRFRSQILWTSLRIGVWIWKN